MGAGGIATGEGEGLVREVAGAEEAGVGHQLRTLNTKGNRARARHGTAAERASDAVRYLWLGVVVGVLGIAGFVFRALQTRAGRRRKTSEAGDGGGARE